MQDCAAVLDCFSPTEDEADSISLTDHPPPTAAESDATHGANREGDHRHDHPDLADDDAARTVDDIEIAAAAVINRHHRPFFCVMTAVSIGGMGVSVFAVLAGGKVGTFLPMSVFETMVFAAVDIAVSLNDAQQADPATNVLSVPNLQQRVGYWLAIGILTGLAVSLWAISLETKHEGATWQPEPLLYQLIFCFVCRIGLTGGVMMRVHRDRRPNVMKWYVLNWSIAALAQGSKCAPYPLILLGGRVLQLLIVTFGLYAVVMKIDKGAEQKDVQNGYKLLFAFGLFAPFNFALNVMSSKKFGPFFYSAVLMLFQKVVLEIVIPTTKKCFGNDERRKFWSYGIPALVLGLELPPCLLLLRSNMATLEFWGLVVFQEANSVAKNTGKYAELYVAVRALLRRPVGEEQLKLMEERRSTLAPCDNIGEIVSPMVIMVVIGLESAFDWLPFERAPYFADSGVLGGWRHSQFRGEAPIMLTIIFMVRVTFCWIEMNVRDRQRPNETDTCATTTDARGANRRRSSMAVLYHRVVRSDDDAPVHMQYLAGALFALQLVLFVEYAAWFGKKLWLEEYS